MKNLLILLVLCFAAGSCQKRESDARNLSINQAVATWSPNVESDLAGYKVHRGTASRNYDFSVIVTAPDTSTTISGLIAGTKYFFAVTAFDTAGNESGFSNEASIMIPIPDTNPPDVPKNLKVVKK